MAWLAISIPLMIVAVALAVVPVLYASLHHERWQLELEAAEDVTGRELARPAPATIPGAPVHERTPLVYLEREELAA